jgi:alkylation response protein AidB-like acyl-CoA dehydrogenase
MVSTAALRDFLAEALPAHRAEWGDATTFPVRLAWQRRLHAGGWVGITWPVADGGRGATVVERVACDLELGRARAPRIAGIIGVNNVGPAIAAYGTSSQRASLPHILSGDEVWCQGFSEPDNGSDLAGLRFRARPVDGGFVLDGTKVWTSNGLDATHCLLLARSDLDAPGHAGISALLVSLDEPGITRRPIRSLDGLDEFAEVHMSGVEVPASALLGPLHGGWRVAMGALAHERAAVVALASEVEETARALVAQLNGHGAAMRGRVVAEYIEARVMWLLAERVLAKLADGQAPDAEQSILKLSWSVRRQASSELVLDLLGAEAMLDTPDATSTGILTARAATIAAGTTEIVKTLLAERVLGLPR